MENSRAFYKCGLCGNLVGLIENGGGQLVCCGRAMTLLAPNTTDAASEKHVPVAAQAEGKVAVTVGSVPHPMTEEHHISWIACAQNGQTLRAELEPTGAPSASFCAAPGSKTLYAYCNLHGLWSADAE